MGFISDIVGKKSQDSGRAPGVTSQARWNEFFRTSNKEDSNKKPIIPPASATRSATSDAAFTRLLQAMRSNSPGGWSDDRAEQSRHLEGIPYVAIHRTGEQLAQAEFQVFRRDFNHQDGKRPVTPDDPPEGNRMCKPYDLVKLLQQPNSYDSFGELMYRWNQQMDMTGKALTWIIPNQLGFPFEMYSIPTALAIPQAVINAEYPQGFYRIQPVYPYGPFSSYPTPSTSVGAPIPAEWMMDFKYPHPLLRYDGYSPMTAMRLHIDEIQSIDKSRWYSMKQVFNPTAVLNFENMEGSQPMPEPEIERIRAELESTQFGPENVGKLFVSTPGANLEEWGTHPVDMDYQNGWDQLISFIMTGFGMTKPVAGMVEGSSYSNLFAALKQFYWLTLDPKCFRIASRLTRTLCPYFGDDLFVEIKCRPINDHEIVHARINLGMQARCITKNEVRKMMEMPMTKEEWGSEIAGTEPMQEEQVQQGPMNNLGDMLQQQVPADPQGENPQTLEEGDGSTPLDALIYGAGDVEAPETESVRPRSGPLGRGGIGPRKSLNGVNGHKSLNGKSHHTKELPAPSRIESIASSLREREERYMIQPIVNVNMPQPVNNVTVNVPKQDQPNIRVDSPVNVHIPKQDPSIVNISVPKQDQPVIHVNVPKQDQPNISVNVPKQEAPVVRVSVPKQDQPAINVHVPKQVPPSVNVNVPSPRMTKKHIAYDEYGRPIQIDEREI